jgi:hypothetical protein
MKRSLVLLLALILLTGLAEGGPQQGSTIMLPLIFRQFGTPVDGKDEYGLDFISSADSRADEARYQKAISTGAGWNRWPLYWYRVEPKANGVFDWNYGDGVVAQDLAHGFKTELILMGTPAEYATGGTADVPPPQVGRRPADWDDGRFSLLAPVSPASTTPQGLYASVFTDGSDLPGPGKVINPNNRWARFVFEVVKHYRPLGVTHYEIWNEQDYSFFWTGTLADYARLLKVAYLAAEQADPAAMILFGGLANFEQPAFLENVLTIYAADPLAPSYHWFFDILATHSYSTAWESWYHVWRADRTMRYRGLDKEIWLNESGSPAWDDYPGPTWDPESWLRSTMEEGAAYVIQSALYAKYAGASRIFHFQLYDDCGNCPAGSDFPPDSPQLCTPGGSSCLCAGDAFGLYRNRWDAVCYSRHPEPDTSRPAFKAFQVLVDHLGGLEPLWRAGPGTQEWIAFYRPATHQRVLALWSLVGSSQTAVVTAVGSSARLVDQSGTVTTLTPQNGVYTLQLGPATNQNSSSTPWSAYSIGGPPLILIETDTSAPDVTVDPKFPISNPAIRVSWSGEDLGSGIRDYDLWVYTDGITRTSWLTDTTVERATYLGEPGLTYGFSAAGRDWAGNENTPPAAPQVVTTVGIAQIYLPVTLDNG